MMRAMTRGPSTEQETTPREVAGGVYWLALGGGVLRSVNVYFIRSDDGWCLVDAGWAGDAGHILRAAERLFGAAPPAAVLLTHVHPDHAGAVPELARRWGVRARVHPAELPLALADPAAIARYAGPLDRYAVLPALRLSGRARRERVLARSSLRGLVQTLDPAASPPGLPGWEVVETPGHTPGHVTFVRAADRVAVTGDALLTVDLNSPRGLLRREPTLAGPPRIATWDWPAALASAARLARLRPGVVAGGHGVPLHGDEAAARTDEFLAAASRHASPEVAAPLRLEPFASAHGALVVRWASSPEEVRRWAGASERWPLQSETLAAWHEDPDVHPYLLLEGDRPAAYGEVWVDAEEREVELARIIVRPGRRGQGLGRALVALLLEQAAGTGYPAAYVRVAPDNARALACYCGAGFTPVPEAEWLQFNAGQPLAYVWLRRPLPA